MRELDLTMQKPEVNASWSEGQKNQLSIAVRAEKYCPNVRIYIPDMDAEFEDNYIDLDPGEERIVRVNILEEKEPEDGLLCIEGPNVSRRVIPLAEIK